MNYVVSPTRVGMWLWLMFAVVTIFSASSAGACTGGTSRSVELNSPAHLNPEQSANELNFRWPVRGRIIFSCSQRTNYLDIAVPEGTPIKASESGVVAYVGNELKPYGNLVVLRHTEGYATAYAHLSEILVKRDDVVKRGDVIAKSGESSNVSSPLLHFEIRKDATIVDPMRYLKRHPN
jgi:murein DD-endopeptidase MepM/ murein hydrolase activator NlpD